MRTAALVVLVICLLCPPCLRADDSPWTELLKNALDLARGNHSDSAIALAHTAVQMAQDAHGASDTAAAYALQELGFIEAWCDRLDDGERHVRQALELWKQAGAGGSPGEALTMLRMAEVLSLQGRHAPAESLVVEVIPLLERALEEDHPDVIRAHEFLARTTKNTGRYAEAESLYERVLELVRSRYGIDSDRMVLACSDLAVVCMHQGRFAEQAEWYEQALDICRRVNGDQSRRAASLRMNLASVYVNLGRLEEAEDWCRQAAATYKELFGPDDPRNALIWLNLAQILKYRGKYDDAEDVLVHAVPLLSTVHGHDRANLAYSLLALGNIYVEQGRYADAEPRYKEALAVSETMRWPENPIVADCSGALARIYTVQGRYDEAESALRRGVSIMEEVFGPDHVKAAPLLMDLADVFAQSERWDKAVRICRWALASFEQYYGESHRHVASCLDNLARLYLDQQMYDQAEPLYERSLAVRRAIFGESHEVVALSLLHLGRIYAETDRPGPAERMYDDALAMYARTTGLNTPAAIACIQGQTDMYFRQGKYAQAERCGRQALEAVIGFYGEQHPDAAACTRTLGRIYACEGEYESAREYLMQAVEMDHRFIDYVFPSSSESQRLRWIDQYPLLDCTLLSLALIDSTAETCKAALETVLRGKARVVDAVMADRQTAWCVNDERISVLQEQMGRSRTAIANLVLADIAGDLTEALRDSLSTRYAETDSLEAELNRHCAEYQDANYNRRQDPAELANSLPEDGVLWEYLRYRPYDFTAGGIHEEHFQPARYAAFVVDHAGGVDLVDLGEAVEIDSLIERARLMIYQAESGIYTPAAPMLEEQLNVVTAQLHQRLVKPLAELSGQAERVYAAPDGALNLLPLEILPQPDGSYVIERYRICYLSSGRDLSTLRHVRSRPQDALVVADPDFERSAVVPSTPARNLQIVATSPLDDFSPIMRRAPGCLDRPFPPLRFSRREALAVSETMFTEGGMVVDELYGREASEEVLKSVDAPGVLHLATHGFFCEQSDSAADVPVCNPLLRCGLALAGANALLNDSAGRAPAGEDGILTAFEVSALDLKATDLAVLSACETGVGEVVRGEGVFGLRRAFQHAGVHTVIMSLWAVPDKPTADLMEGFYRRWLGGERKLDGFRNSALDLLNASREQRGHAHPLLWGGFVLLGDPD